MEGKSMIYSVKIVAINPPRRIDIYENNDQFLVAWERPSGSKACDVTYQVTINVDSAAVVNEQTKAENFVLSHNFEEDYCSVIEINVQAMSNQMKSAVTREEFMIGSKDNCDQAIDTRESEDVDLAQRMAVDPVEENANELMKRMFVALDERNGLLEYS
ncbi:hypothetical protein Trydic_g6602 [Trypoxylus dichotomus]